MPCNKQMQGSIYASYPLLTDPANKAYESHLLQMKLKHQVLSSFSRKPKEIFHIGNASVLLSILHLDRPMKSVLL